MKKILVLLILFSLKVYSQNNTYKILDFDTKTPIAFANIIFDDDVYSGTISDIDGVFKVSNTVNTLTINLSSYLIDMHIFLPITTSECC